MKQWTRISHLSRQLNKFLMMIVFKGVSNPIDNPPSVKNKKKRSLAFEDELLSTCLQVMKCPKEDVNDADIVFGQYVSKQLKKIPEGYAKEMLKIEIQQCLLKVMLPVAQPLSNIVTISFDDLNDK